MRLAMRRRHLDAEEEAQFDTLRNVSSHRLIDATKAPVLTSEEKNAIREAFLRATRELANAGLVEEVVGDVVGALSPVLEEALKPDPRVRLASATPLRRACVEAHDLLARALGRNDRTVADAPVTVKLTLSTSARLAPPHPGMVVPPSLGHPQWSCDRAATRRPFSSTKTPATRSRSPSHESGTTRPSSSVTMRVRPLPRPSQTARRSRRRTHQGDASC